MAAASPKAHIAIFLHAPYRAKPPAFRHGFRYSFHEVEPTAPLRRTPGITTALLLVGKHTAAAYYITLSYNLLIVTYNPVPSSSLVVASVRCRCHEHCQGTAQHPFWLKSSHLIFFQKVRFSPNLPSASQRGERAMRSMPATPCDRPSPGIWELTMEQGRALLSCLFTASMVIPKALAPAIIIPPCQATVNHVLTCRDSLRHRSCFTRLCGAMPCSAVPARCVYAAIKKEKRMLQPCVSTTCHPATKYVETHCSKSIENTGFCVSLSTLLNFSTSFRDTRPIIFNMDLSLVSMLFPRGSLTYALVRHE